MPCNTKKLNREFNTPATRMTKKNPNHQYHCSLAQGLIKCVEFVVDTMLSSVSRVFSGFMFM
jgi:hypothetical protein